MDDDKRECILKAAVRMFSGVGFRKTSIDEVAQQAGVGKGTVYLAVSSKDELFLAAIEREVKAFIVHGRAALGAFDDAVEMLAGLVRAELREMKKRPLVHGLMVGQTLQTVPQARLEIERLLGLARDNLVSAVEGLRDAQVLRDDLEPDVAARLLQDLEIATLMRPESSDIDWRRPIGLVVRGLRRPLALAPLSRTR